MASPDAPLAVRSSDLLARWDIDPATGEAKEWWVIAKQDLEGSEWVFPKGKWLCGFKDLRDDDWWVYPQGQSSCARLAGVPESLLKIVRPVRRANEKLSD